MKGATTATRPMRMLVCMSARPLGYARSNRLAACQTELPGPFVPTCCRMISAFSTASCRDSSGTEGTDPQQAE
jgi:hypothetical protein